MIAPMNNEICIQAIEVRISLLEREFKATDQRDSRMIYLLQVELANAYNTYLRLVDKRIEMPEHATV